MTWCSCLPSRRSKLTADPTWGGLGRGMLVLAAVWWAWTAYSWLTNEVDAEEDLARVVVFSAMAAMLIVALTVPEAFDRYALLFGCSYLVVKVLHVVLYDVAARDDPQLRRAVLRLAPGVVLGPVLIIAASAFDGATQAAIWVVALAIDYGAPVFAGTEGWRVSPGHFAERYGLIIIIALGESIVAVGAGVVGIDLDAGVVVAAILAMVIVGCLWWIYFDVVAVVAEKRLREEQGAERNRLARDSYSYLHLPMIAAIVLLALGIKKALPHLDEPLKTIPAVSLCGGIALYLIAHVLFRLRNMHTLARRRVVGASVCLALIPLALEVDAGFALAAVTVVLVVLLVYEVIRFREPRARLRASLHVQRD